MYISLEDSRSIGFKEWSDAHQIKHFKNEVGVGAFAIQYGLIAVLIAVAAVTVLSTVGTNL